MTDATHSGGIVVLQVTLAPGVESSSLSALTVTVWIEKSAAAWMHGKYHNIEIYIIYLSFFSFQIAKLGVCQLVVVIEVPEREHVCPPASIQQLQLLSTNKAVRASHDINLTITS